MLDREPYRSRIQTLNRRRRLLLQVERLEPRNLLAGDLDNNPWGWFEFFDDVPRVSPAKLGIEIQRDHTAMGPHDLVAGEWVAQLQDDSWRSVNSLETVDHLLDQQPVEFTVIGGLGTPGLVLVRSRSATLQDASDALRRNDHVEHFHANSVIEAQMQPNDPEFVGGLLTGLDTIDASCAWNTTRGSSQVVVGVVDGGIDATHPDLFLNIWLNQGEIPAGLRDQLVDVDNDGLISFYDLNNLQPTDGGIIVASSGALATVEQMTTATPYRTGANAGLVVDKNANGRIDAIDLLEDVIWADGRDTDGNTFFDDLFGVNFRSGAGDPFPSNRPMDELGHGTHVSGTIGAIGNNGFGISGVNWQTSLMSLRILDNNNQSDASAAIRAINYAKSMRSQFSIEDGRVERGANVRVLNNSWGQPGGFDLALETTIRQSGEEGILFVAAAGNGNLLGNGVDNDRTPFYPASYESANVIAVAALSASGDRLATFSNYGEDSVDIAAPGVGVRSTLPGGAIGPANGTSMATPHVSGTAALIWAAMPAASVEEVRESILSTVDPIAALTSTLSTGGRLNAGAAVNANVFAPTATLIASQDITTAGGTNTEFTVEYRHRGGIDPTSIGDDDLTVTRQWGPSRPIDARLKPGTIVVDGETATATYVIDALDQACSKVPRQTRLKSSQSDPFATRWPCRSTHKSQT